MDDAEFDQPEQQDKTHRNRGGNAYFGPHGAPEMEASAAAPSDSLRGRLSRNVPMPSAVFTGRENELRQLHDAMQREISVLIPVPRVLQGVSGVGKTQIAAQYAHEHRAAFDGVFWVNGDTPDTFVVEFVVELAALAPELVPPLPILPNQNATFQAVQAWFAVHTDWLLIVDNAANLRELNPLLPRHPTGLVLLTTQEPMPPGFGQCLPIEPLDATMGATLLLRRAGTLAPDATLDAAEAVTQTGAKQLSAELNGLPLALDQAGAFLAQQNVVPQKYLALCKARIPRLPCAYTDTDRQAVAVTSALALEQMKRLPHVGRYAAELTLFAAFLGSDTLPNELILRGKSVPEGMPAWYSDEALNINEVTAAACAYGLLRPAPNSSVLWIHRLTRDVLRENLPAEAQNDTMARFILAVEAAFPSPEPANWPLCERLMPHALRCTAYIAQSEIPDVTATHLLEKMAGFSQQRVQYEDALRLRKGALRVTRLMYGDEHTDVVTSLGEVGRLCRDMGREEEAAVYLEEAIAIGCRLAGDASPDDTRLLNNLAHIYYWQGRFEEAAALYRQTLTFAQRTQGAQHPEVARRLNNLAMAYTNRERYEEARTLLQEALTIDRLTIGQEHPDMALHLLDMGILYVAETRFAEAEPLFRQALSIYERRFGLQHPQPALCLIWMGAARYKQRDLTAAADFFQRSWETRERTLGPGHTDTLQAREWLDRVQRELAG